MIVVLLAAMALADEVQAAPVEKKADPVVKVDFGGDLKSFLTAVFPYDSVLLPPDPTGQGVADGRLKLTIDFGDHVELEAHHAITVTAGSGIGATGGFGTGVGLSAPEAIPLTWCAERNLDCDAQAADAELTVRGRTDRLVATLHVPHLDVAVGRQPISFGTGAFFTPMDLVNPFTPTTIDSEYKPGVDAVRVDVYAGMSGRVTVAAAYAGDWNLRGVVLAASGQVTVGVSDLTLFLGAVHADAVVGLGIVTAVGPVGVHADATFTVPETDVRPVLRSDPFVRAVAGADWRPGAKTTLSGEVYVQTLGASDPAGYLERYATDPRIARGELWQVGRYYAAVAVAQEITPLVSGSVAIFANLGDPSAIVAPNVSWSAGENTAVSGGVYVGLGKRPEGLVLRSELGTTPVTGFLRIATYF